MSVNDHNYAEKREYLRMFIDAPVELAIVGTNDCFSGMCSDLSGGGLAFETEHKLSVDDKIEVKLHPVMAVTPPFETIVTVIRIDETDDGKFLVSTKIGDVQS